MNSKGKARCFREITFLLPPPPPTSFYLLILSSFLYSSHSPHSSFWWRNETRFWNRNKFHGFIHFFCSSFSKHETLLSTKEHPHLSKLYFSKDLSVTFQNQNKTNIFFFFCVFQKKRPSTQEKRSKVKIANI